MVVFHQTVELPPFLSSTAKVKNSSSPPPLPPSEKNLEESALLPFSFLFFCSSPNPTAKETCLLFSGGGEERATVFHLVSDATNKDVSFLPPFLSFFRERIGSSHFFFGTSTQNCFLFFFFFCYFQTPLLTRVESPLSFPSGRAFPSLPLSSFVWLD